jgi:hypothetical protein
MTDQQQTIQPELLLREYFQTNTTIIRRDNYLHFSDTIVLKIDTPTPFLQKSTNKYYSLGALWFYLKYKDEQLKIYINQCRKEKVESVSSLDKQQVIRFFINGVDDVQIYNKSEIESTKVLLGNKRNNLSENSNENKNGNDNLNGGSNLNSLTNHNKNNENTNINSIDKNNLKKDNTENLIIQNAGNYKENGNVDLLLNEDPNKKIMDCLLVKERKNLNRNSMIRLPSIKFDYLLNLTRKTFCSDGVKDQINKDQPNSSIKNHKNTFLDELINNEGKFFYYFIYNIFDSRIRNKSNYYCPTIFCTREYLQKKCLQIFVRCPICKYRSRKNNRRKFF